MKTTMTMDMELVHNIANTLALIADGLIEGDINCSEEAKKNIILTIDALLEGIETAAHLEIMGVKAKLDAFTSDPDRQGQDNIIVFPTPPIEA